MSAVLGLGAWPAAARNMLPLEPGIYVDARRPCKGASNADTLSYWGGDSGINAQSMTCKIRVLETSRRMFTLRSTCSVVGHDEHAFQNQVTVKITTPTSFMIDDRSPPAFAGPTYRYCGRKVEF